MFPEIPSEVSSVRRHHTTLRGGKKPLNSAVFPEIVWKKFAYTVNTHTEGITALNM